MKCNNCELQYVEYDPSSVVEMIDESVYEGKVDVRFIVNLSCPNCGTPQLEREIDTSIPIEHNCGSEDRQFELFDIQAKFIKETRDSAVYYGGEFTINLRCEYCAEDIQIEKIITQPEPAFRLIKNGE